jgi:Tn7-like transposition protein D/TniQ
VISCFPDPFPDEILYSVWARYRDHVQYPSLQDTFRELFGNSKAYPIVDLPCHLKFFFDNLPIGHKYTIDFFIDQCTLLPFYAPFLPQDRFHRLKEQMIEGHGQALHRRLGIGWNSLLSPRWLRYCPVCLEEDRKSFGERYWHRLHQVPGVEICLIHKTFLENSAIPIRSTFAKHDLVSAERALRISAPRTAVTSPFFNSLMSVAQDTSYLLEHPQSSPGNLFFTKQYQCLLMRRGFMTLGGQIRTYGLLKAFIDYFPPELLKLLHCEMKQVNPNNSWLSRLFHFSNEVSHPVQHLLAIQFLGSNVETFFNQNLTVSPPFGDGPWPCLNPACRHYRKKHILICQIREHVGESHIAGKFACNCGFIYSRSGPDFSPEDIFRRDTTISFGRVWETELRKLWFDLTLTCSDIAQRLGVTESTVRRQAARLQLPVPRHPDWKWKGGELQKHTTKDTDWYRAQWLTLLSEMPEATVYKLRARSRDVWNWLLQNDREWYDAHLPPRKSRRSPPVQVYVDSEPLGKTSLYKDVESYDYHIAETVRRVAQKLIDNPGPPKKVSAAEISRHVPEVRRLKYQPDKAPLTERALQEAIETREAFAIRRLEWVVRKYQEEQILPQRGNLIERAHLGPILSNPAVKQALDEIMDRIASRVM